MSGYKRYSRRPFNERSYRKLYLVATEGKTEREYLGIIQNMISAHIKIVVPDTNDKSSPSHVVKRMEKARKNQDLRKGDEAWLVIDKDSWTDQQLKTAFDWTTGHRGRSCALSNPKFEYWLLLHFESPPSNVTTGKSVQNKLRIHLSEYDKHIRSSAITNKSIGDAIDRAKKRDRNRTTDYPTNSGSTMYQLIESIFKSAEIC